MPSINIPPQCRPPDQSEIDAVERVIPRTLNNMESTHEYGAPVPAEGERIVLYFHLVRELCDKQYFSKDAVLWAIYQLIREGKLTHQYGCMPQPFVVDKNWTLDTPDPISFDLQCSLIGSTPALWEPETHTPKVNPSVKNAETGQLDSRGRTMCKSILSVIADLTEFAVENDSGWTLDAAEERKVNVLDFQLGEESKRLGMDLPQTDSVRPALWDSKRQLQFLRNSKLPYESFPYPWGEHNRAKANRPYGASPGPAHMLPCVSSEWLQAMQGLKATAEYLMEKEDPPAKDVETGNLLGSAGPSQSLIAALDALEAFATKQRDQRLTEEQCRPAEDLDARIEMLCRAVDVPPPGKRTAPNGMSYLPFTQLPFWWESRAGVEWAENPTPAPFDDSPLGKQFVPDDEWFGSMRRLRLQAEVLRKLQANTSKTSEPKEKTPEKNAEKGGVTKRGPKGPRNDPAKDKRIFDAWKSGHYRDYAELATELHLKRRDVERAIDRHEKRIKPKE